jgi:farnesyl-diphosphate farnesyltransferase
MNRELGTDILKGVSRSFYLTLRLLPAAMREAASLGYLLARTSDTVADTAGVPAVERLALLSRYATAVQGGGMSPEWPAALLEGAEPKEKLLLERSDAVLDRLACLAPGEALLIREVVDTIISGQVLDLKRFSLVPARVPVCLPDDAALEDYAWRVAGCVGAFWTKLGFLNIGEGYSSESQEILLEKGAAYGKGLQLVNILRDLPRDLAAGRCYLPVKDPTDQEELMAAFRVWHGRAEQWIGKGIGYAGTLRSRRLRASTVLPALIAEDTLKLLDGVSWQDLQQRVKVPRHRIYRLMAEGFLF